MMLLWIYENKILIIFNDDDNTIIIMNVLYYYNVIVILIIYQLSLRYHIIECRLLRLFMYLIYYNVINKN